MGVVAKISGKAFCFVFDDPKTGFTLITEQSVRESKSEMDTT